MSDGHLANTIRFLRRRAVAWILKDLGGMGRYIEDAPGRRGDGG